MNGVRSVDLDAARLSVRNAVAAVAYEVIDSTPKNHNARVIDLDQETVGLLRAYRQRQLDERELWCDNYEDQDLVIAKENGTSIHPHSFSQTFERLIKQAGIRTIRLHDLRHTHATLALKAGVPVKVVSERLGHESPAFTLKQYAHVLPSPGCRRRRLPWSLNSSELKPNPISTQPDRLAADARPPCRLVAGRAQLRRGDAPSDFEQLLWHRDW